jgi:hypothetical protein
MPVNSSQPLEGSGTVGVDEKVIFREYRPMFMEPDAVAMMLAK